MKVYTHYKANIIVDNSSYEYRWRTILQFGSSWNIIGSVVMKNPGSAKYLNGNKHWIEDRDILTRLESFDYYCDSECGEKWYEFHSDTTMECVAELFAQKMGVDDKSKLQGVVQIFNLFYLREQDSGKAIKTIKSVPSIMAIDDRIYENDIRALRAPIYLGFGKLAKSSIFREKALSFFSEAVNNYNAHYLDVIFEKNHFYHPLALMRFRKNDLRYSTLRDKFCSS